MKEMLKYLLETAPLSDLDCYPTEVLEDFARHGAFLRSEIPWCREMPEEIFKCYVLYHRVNDEDLSRHRKLFFDLLYPRVRDLNVEEAVLETNRWCHEYATYRLQDDRTAAPLTVFRCGSGRCGEESTFLVSALRSIGIAARQVYVPRWSHCDDNHAWVEAYVNGTWHFLGGCEPEPKLNAGCFNQTSSRAMLIHSRLFSKTRAENEEALDTLGCVTWFNQIRRYAKTKRYTFRVQKQGEAVPGAQVRLEMLNQGRLRGICSLLSDEKGEVQVEMGIGDLHVAASLEEWYAEAFLHGEEMDGLTLNLEPMGDMTWKQVSYHAPKAVSINPLQLNAQQREKREEVLREGCAIREKRLAGFFCEEKAARFENERDLLEAAYGNFDEIYAFLSRDEDELRAALLRSLQMKDLRDSKAEMLEDHLRGAKEYQGSMPQEIFEKYVLCPRVAWELLTPWRGKLKNAWSEEEKQAIQNNPAFVWTYLQKKIHLENEKIYENLYWTPDAAMEKQRCDEKSLRVLAVACLRALGIPARLNPQDEWTVEYWRKGNFEAAEKMESAVLQLSKPAQSDARYDQQWTLERWEKNAWRMMKLSENPWEGEDCSITLQPGMYRLVTAARKLNGDQEGAVCRFALTAGETKMLSLLLPQEDEKLEQVELPEAITGLQGKGVPSVACFIVPGEEPTERILREMVENQGIFESINTRLTLFSKGGRSAMLDLLQKSWPQAELLETNWNETFNAVCACLKYDPEMPPLAIAASSCGEMVYADGGFNAGCAELMARRLAKIENGCAQARKGS